MEPGVIELVPNQPTLLDVLALVSAVERINDANFTKEITMALHRVNNPIAIFKPGGD